MSIGSILSEAHAVYGLVLTLLSGSIIYAVGFSLVAWRPGVVNTSSRVGFPVGLAILLTVAGEFDPPPTGTHSAAGIAAGFQVAVIAASLIRVRGFLIALRLKDVKPPWASGNWKPNEMAAQEG